MARRTVNKFRFRLGVPEWYARREYETYMDGIACAYAQSNSIFCTTFTINF